MSNNIIYEQLFPFYQMLEKKGEKTHMFKTIDFMGTLLDVKFKRHELISNNLANVDTPGYKRYDISFEELLKSKINRKSISLTKTNDKHMDSKKGLSEIRPQIYRDESVSYRNNNNNVDIDKEIVEMVKNAMAYNIISEQISTNFKLLGTAISEGRK